MKCSLSRLVIFCLEPIGPATSAAHTAYTSYRQLGWTDHEHRPFFVFNR